MQQIHDIRLGFSASYSVMRDDTALEDRIIWRTLMNCKALMRASIDGYIHRSTVAAFTDGALSFHGCNGFCEFLDVSEDATNTILKILEIFSDTWEVTYVGTITNHSIAEPVKYSVVVCRTVQYNKVQNDIVEYSSAVWYSVT